MKKYIQSLLIFGAACSVACQTDQTVETPITPATPTVQVAFGATQANNDTRTEITENGTTFSTAWTADDELTIRASLNGGTAQTADFTYDTEKQQFKGEMTAGQGAWRYLAVYPAATVSGTTASIPFGAARTQTGAAYNYAYDAMYADVVNTTDAAVSKNADGTNVQLTFHRATALLKLSFTETGVTTVTLTADCNIAANTLNVNLENGAATLGTGASKSIALTLDGATQTAWFNLPAQTYHSIVVTLDNGTTRKHYSFPFSASGKAYNAGTLYRATLGEGVQIVPEVEISTPDLWLNTATVTLANGLDDCTMTAFEYRLKGTSAWKSATVSANTATIAPNWVSYTSATAEMNTPNSSVQPFSRPEAGTGLFAGNTYEYRYTVDGITYEGASDLVVPAATQTIPSLDNSSLPCYQSGSSRTSDFWNSGNNNTTKTLCTHLEGGALMQSSAPGIGSTKVLAAGNLFTGDFSLVTSGLTKQTGTVKFGKGYTWDARPTALRLTYKAATVGKVDRTGAGTKDILASGAQDYERIYFAIVDWSDAHAVASTPKVLTTKAALTGQWDPETTTSVTEGAIIGYGSMWINAAVSDFTTVEIPANFYDQTKKPSSSITIVISCAANAFGDYFNGCSTNNLTVKDFEWVY